MNEESIVAVFDSTEHADEAVRDLIAADIPERAISKHARIASGTAPAGQTQADDLPREEGFWSRLFGGEREYDNRVYDRSVESGSTVVSVRVSEEHVTRVSEILDRHHPIDIDERASGYGLTSTSSGAVAAAPPPGYEQPGYDAPMARNAETAYPDETFPTGAAQRTTGSDIADTGVVPPATAYDDAALRTPANTGTGGAGLDESETLRLAEERLKVGKRLVNRGGTRVRRYVVETPVEEQVTLHDERVTLDRRPVTDGRPVTDADFTDRTIEMSETREEAVVSKEVVATEEVRLRKEAVEHVETVRDTVRRQEVEVERIGEEAVTAPRR